MTISSPDLPRLALSIRQPWAHACAAGWKNIENRNWRTAIRGPICIHASALNKRNFEEDREDYLEVLHEHIGRLQPPTHEKVALEGLAFGAIIGTATIVDCVSRSDSPWFFGRFGFVLKHQQLLDTPIPVKGALGFFEWRPRSLNPVPAQPAETFQKDLF